MSAGTHRKLLLAFAIGCAGCDGGSPAGPTPLPPVAPSAPSVTAISPARVRPEPHLPVQPLSADVSGNVRGPETAMETA
jgi:hypothetical protein